MGITTNHNIFQAIFCCYGHTIKYRKKRAPEWPVVAMSGPVVVFLTIFLVLLYHLTCVLHSISLAKENLEVELVASQRILHPF